MARHTPPAGPAQEGVTDAPQSLEEIYQLLVRTRVVLGRHPRWQDAVQDSARRVVQHPPTRRVTQAWANTVVRNAIRQSLRGEKAAKRGGRDAPTIPLAQVELVDPAEGLEVGVAEAQDRAWLLDALTSLSDKERQVISLHLRGLMSPEIAVVMHTTDNAVRAHCRRALTKLVELGKERR
jgi:RNA polymerase sigma factor (sigma-70 family)